MNKVRQVLGAENTRLLYGSLLEIVRRIEANELPDTVEIRGTSYFFSESTVKRLGFDVKAAPFLEKVNIVFNYIDLNCLYSISKDKLTFPKLNQIKTATTTGKKLLAHKMTFIKIKEFIDQRPSKD